MIAIVYESHAGHTRDYAVMLGEKLELPVFSLRDAKKCLPKGQEIIFMGWMMAGVLKGWKKAKHRYLPKAVCAVGMGTPEREAAFTIAKKNGALGLPIFMIRGGLDMAKLRPVYRMMMERLISFLEKKKDRPADMQGLIDVARSKKDLPIEAAALAPIIEWYEACER